MEIFYGFKVVNIMYLEDTKRLLKNLMFFLYVMYGLFICVRVSKKVCIFVEYECDFCEIKYKEESMVKVTWMRMFA